MTGTREPVVIGEVLEQTVGQLYHDQMLKEYWQAGEQLALNAMVLLCLAARRFDHRVKFVVLDDSDQGEWQTVAGLCSVMPTVVGRYAEADLDSDDEFDDEGWASNLSDQADHAWRPFVSSSETLPGWCLLDVDRVLAEVHLPWRPVTGANPHSFREGLPVAGPEAGKLPDLGVVFNKHGHDGPCGLPLHSPKAGV